MLVFEMEGDNKMITLQKYCAGINPIRHLLKTEVVRCTSMEQAMETQDKS